VNRTDRLVAILLELQARGEARAEDLARHFEVSVRTMYRDLEALSEGGVPLVATPGKGYRLMEGYFLPPLTFTGAEAALLVLGGEFVRERVDPELRRVADAALSKLTGVLPEERRQAVARWRREMLFARFGRADDARLGQVRAAIQQRRVLRLDYHAFRRAGPERRDVEPVSLVYFGQVWSVAGYCRLRQAMRMFRLDRMDRLEVLPERFELADRHALRGPTDEWKADATEARVRFDASVERWVRERQPHAFVREELDAQGPTFVYAIRDADELVAWLLSWGDGATVLGPPELRARLAQTARAIAARHLDAAAPLGRGGPPPPARHYAGGTVTRASPPAVTPASTS
jgi:predicted DNA-binding transcriptional regulator YafY